MSNNFYKTYHGYILFFILYLSLIFGFYFDENLNFGAIPDWLYTDLPVINDLSHNIKKTLLNYEVYGHRHSPIYLIFLSIFKKIGFSLDAIRFLHLNLSLFLIIFFLQMFSIKIFQYRKKYITITIFINIFISNFQIFSNMAELKIDWINIFFNFYI